MDNQEKRYLEALQWIHGLGRFGIKPGLERITALLEVLGNPQQMVTFVHIAGTNGKGSTAVMLASMLQSAGYKIGLYTSPFLLSFTNRMAVNGTDIDQEELIELVDLICPLVDKISSDSKLGAMTEFEVVTALALTYFARRKVDLVVLEVGLGGRLDATNVVSPLLSIITNVSLEHTDVLGDTVEEITEEKAGIIKRGRPLITAAEDPVVLSGLKERCLQLGASFKRVYSPRDGKPCSPSEKPCAALQEITPEGQLFSYHGYNLQLDDLFIPLRGSYQVANALTALAAVEMLKKEGFLVDEKALRSGLAATVWPGRLELLSKEPLLIIDGAHNPGAIEKLSEALPCYFNYQRLILVIGMLADKDTAAMLEHILPLADSVVFTRPVLPRAADPADIAAFAKEHFNLQKEHYVIAEHEAALEKAFELATVEDAVLVTGSLYTVSDIRAYFKQRL